MRRLITKKGIAVGVAVPVLAPGGIVAYAFWTTGGSGSGTASTTHPISNLTVTVSVPTAMTLAGSAEPVDIVSVNNPNGYSVDLKGDPGVDHHHRVRRHNGTERLAYARSGTITDTTVYPASVLTTNTSPPASGLTLQMNDDVSADQDICQAATVTFTISVGSAGMGSG
jgi:hypothetical protein